MVYSDAVRRVEWGGMTVLFFCTLMKAVLPRRQFNLFTASILSVSNKHDGMHSSVSVAHRVPRFTCIQSPLSTKSNTAKADTRIWHLPILVTFF